VKKNCFEAISTIMELKDEDAATCSGGVSYIGGSNPDVILYKDAGFNGPSLAVNASIGDGLNYVGDNFNDVTSSFVILRGQWELYRDANYGRPEGIYGPGVYSSLPPGVVNDDLSSLFRVA
jgi:hypothetical protein